MRTFLGLTALIVCLQTVLGAPATDPSLKEVQRTAGPKKPNSYIVTLKKGTSRDSHLQRIKGLKSVYDENFFNGFAAELSANELNLLRASPDVESIEEDAIMTSSSLVTQTDAPWGLQRISQNGLVTGNPNDLNFTYKYDSSAGAGVDVYVIDTGIYLGHNEFEGRAKWGATFGGYPNADGNGHGTHIAGTIGGHQFGVAKLVNLIAVKVLSDAGSGAVSDIISGLNYVLTSAKASGRPSVVNMSLGGSANTALDNAVVTLLNAGIHVVVAAGNSASDVSLFSPARVPGAITVIACDINDTVQSSSNYGSGIDICAPGVIIISAWIGSPTARATLTGGSMATAHVSGLVAYLIALNGNSTPAAMSTLLKSLAVKGAIKGIPSGTPNNLANNEF